ncbi:ribonuclease Z [Kordiimonas sediminis]|uniref:Ribonuclease Z n=1 Tax=Kordiimonas sediminis TaxID=1735581 RepID=A0A919AYC3_9PROT|nr:MBL fold metallo-hydrolase [Kordiimonas sediminis]GHF30795.1 ribonuclease Z [Kordiimonas sediminis]
MIKQLTALFVLITSVSLTASASDMKLVILGTGNPNADPDRSGPALAVVANGQPYLIDAGPGVVRRASAAGLEMPSLSMAFITHLHSDHTVGLSDLIFTPWVLEREKPINLFGPPGLAAMADHISKAYAVDVSMRLNGAEPANETGYKHITTEIAGGYVFTDQNIQVEAIQIDHGSFDAAFGYKFTAGDKTIVISGDTGPSDTLEKAAMGADILAHEVYSAETFKTRPPVWQNYHSQFHTSTHELAAIANRVKPKLLVLYHQLYWGATDEDLIKEIRAAGYNGPVVSAADLDVFAVPSEPNAK